MIPAWLMVMIGSSDDSRMARFRAWASASAVRRRGLLVGLAVDDHQAGGAAALVRLDAEHLGLHVDEFAGLAALRSRLRPSQRPVLLTAGPAASRSSAHDSSA